MFYATQHTFTPETRDALLLALLEGGEQERQASEQVIYEAFIRVSTQLFESKYYNGKVLYKSALRTLNARESEDDFPEFLTQTLHELFRPLILDLILEPKKAKSPLEMLFVRTLSTVVQFIDIDDFAKVQDALKRKT